MKNNNTQVLNTILIVLGGGILIYTIATEEPQQYLQIAGFIMIMLGLYRATNFWVETKDDHKEEKEKQDTEL